METLVLTPPNIEKKIWAIGGGKGGTGKSIVTSSLGIHLSKMGKRVLIIDADLGGANLHTCLGMKYPKATLSDFLNKNVKSLTDVLIDSPFQNLKIISGANDFLNAANPMYVQKVKLIHHIKSLPMDYILIDIGSGTSYNAIDFFVISNYGIVVAMPEPTSIENLYRFLIGSIMRILKFSMNKEELRRFFQKYTDLGKKLVNCNMNNLIEELEKFDNGLSKKIRSRIESFRPRLIINQVRDKKDLSLGQSITQVAKRYLGIRVSYLGCIPYDDNVPRSIKRCRPFIVENPDCPASLYFNRLGERLLNGANK